jgi:hypothetical protein
MISAIDITPCALFETLPATSKTQDRPRPAETAGPTPFGIDGNAYTDFESPDLGPHMPSSLSQLLDCRLRGVCSVNPPMHAYQLAVLELLFGM